MHFKNTRRGFIQKTVVMIKKEIIPEFISGSSTHIIAQQPQQAWKMPKQVRQYTYFTHRGFTLIELLVVVLIIGILAAVALPQYQLAVAKSEVSVLLPLMKSIDQAEQLYYMQYGTYIKSYAALDIQMPPGTKQTSDTEVKFENWSCAFTPGPYQSLKCFRKNITLEKYFVLDQTICWADEENTLANKICQLISGKTVADTKGSGTTSAYYF